jgi:hypothetical protein
MNTNAADPFPAELPDGIKKRIRVRLSRDAGPCPDTDLLDRYGRRELHGRALRRIEEHLIGCPACMEVTGALTRPDEAGPEGAGTQPGWEAIEGRLDRDFYERLKTASAPAGRSAAADSGERRLSRLKSAWQDVLAALLRPRRLAVAASLAAVTLTVAYSAAFLSRSRYFELSRIRPEKIQQMRSGSELEGFEEGIRLYGRGRYTAAIPHLTAACGSAVKNYTACYYLGLSHLSRAESGLPGLAFRFDGTDVEKGIDALGDALELAGDNPHYRGDCRWHLGKALLMQGKTGEAVAQFEGILQLEGIDPSRTEAALDMLARIR